MLAGQFWQIGQPFAGFPAGLEGRFCACCVLRIFLDGRPTLQVGCHVLSCGDECGAHLVAHLEDSGTDAGAQPGHDVGVGHFLAHFLDGGLQDAARQAAPAGMGSREIGRASCRERV